jgi:hypothetical protein
MKNALVAMTVTCSLALTACSNSGGTIYRKDTVGPYNVLSVDARQRLVLQGEKIGSDGISRPVICTEPSPDAISAQAVSLAASASVPLGGKQTGSGQVAGGFSETVASIAMRTQTIQLLRDGYFRLCEAYMNGALDQRDYKGTLYFIDEFMATVLAIEAIGGTVQTPPVAISANASATINKDSANSEENKPGTNLIVFPEKFTVNTPQGNKEAAEQIRFLLDRYYTRKAEYQKFIHSEQPAH